MLPLSLKGKTVFWNGPMGVFEMKAFEHGTKAVAEASCHEQGTRDHHRRTFRGCCEQVPTSPAEMTFISTGGGASMELVEGKPFPASKRYDNLRGLGIAPGGGAIPELARTAHWAVRLVRTAVTSRTPRPNPCHFCRNVLHCIAPLGMPCFSTVRTSRKPHNVASARDQVSCRKARHPKTSAMNEESYVSQAFNCRQLENE